MRWLEFIAYFVILLIWFAGLWCTLGKAFDKLEDRQDRRFEEKVDRYRRGHR